MSMQRPEHYIKLPDGVRCRCVYLWREVDGSHWCCNVNKAPQPVTIHEDEEPKVGKRTTEMDEQIAKRERAFANEMKKAMDAAVAKAAGGQSSVPAQAALTQEDVYANCWATLIGFSNELTERDRKFICDQIAQKVVLAAQPPAAPVETDGEKAARDYEYGYNDGVEWAQTHGRCSAETSGLKAALEVAKNIVFGAQHQADRERNYAKSAEYQGYIDQIDAAILAMHGQPQTVLRRGDALTDCGPDFRVVPVRVLQSAYDRIDAMLANIEPDLRAANSVRIELRHLINETHAGSSQLSRPQLGADK